VIAGLLVDHQQTTFHQRQRGEADLSSGIRLPVGHRQRCPTARQLHICATSSARPQHDPADTPGPPKSGRAQSHVRDTRVARKGAALASRRGQQTRAESSCSYCFFPRVSDGSNPRPPDHNPKDPVVSTRSLPVFTGFRPFELVPLVLRLVHELVHEPSERVRIRLLVLLLLCQVRSGICGFRYEEFPEVSGEVSFEAAEGFELRFSLSDSAVEVRRASAGRCALSIAQSCV